MTLFFSGSAAEGACPLKSADPGGQGGVWGLEEVRILESALFEGIRGEGAEAALGSSPVHAGVSFCMVWAIDSTLWRFRDRFAGIPARRGSSGDHFRRFGDDFGVKKWT